MSKRCPNCGFTESDDASVCHICGKPLVEEANFTDDFDYDFGADTKSGETESTFETAPQSFGEMQAAGTIPIKLSDFQANKLRKNVVSLSASLIIICIIRLVVSLIDISDVREIQYQLPFVGDSQIYSVVNTAVNLYYAAIVIVALTLAAAIVQLIFSIKLNKYVFPVQDSGVFEDSKKAFYASLPTLVLVVALLIVQVYDLINLADMQRVLGESDMGMSDSVIPLVITVFLVVDTAMQTSSALKLSKCRRA